MSAGRLTEAREYFRLAVSALQDSIGLDAPDDALFDALRLGQAVARDLQRVDVDAVAGLRRRGAFSERGQRAASALADLLGIEYLDARRLVTAADQATPRVDLQGQPLPPVLPATAAAFAAGAASVRHVEVIARLMAGAAASNLPPEKWAGAEAQIAAHAGDYGPTMLRDWGGKLLSLLDQDGTAPDDREPEGGNELRLTRDRHGNGGWIKGRFTDGAMYDVLASVLGAKSAPLTADDKRPLERRQAEAMAEIFGWVANHGDTAVAPAQGGRRPHVNVLIRLEDLEARARAAFLDYGGTVVPSVLRAICCDACVIPIVMDGAGQPLDVGRKSRTVPGGLRRAVTARDRGCAHPNCTRPPSWAEIHHIEAWELGGETALTNLVMLCWLHHREIHSSGWTVRIASDGLPKFIPPIWIDPEQRPRRNPTLVPTGTADP